MARRSTLLLLFVVLQPGAVVAKWQSDLLIKADYAATVRGATERSQKAELTLVPKLRWRGGGARFTGSARVRGDAYDRLEPGQPELRSYSDASRRRFLTDQAEGELRAFYFDLRPGDTFLRVGKQQVVWGQADGLKVLDRVNPQSFREFILPDFDESRIPLWTVNWEIPTGPGMTQLLWIPDRTYNDLPRNRDLYAFSSPLLTPPAPPNVPVTVDPVQRPDDFFADSDYGARWSAFVGGWDLSLNYLYHYHDNPVPFTERTATGVVVKPRYERTHLLGATFTNAFGDYTLRNEIAVSSDRWFPAARSEDRAVLETEEASWVLGLDWRGLDDTMISAQVFQNAVDLPSRRLVRDSLETDVTLVLRRDFAYDTFRAEVMGIHNLNRDDGLVRPGLTWKARSNLEVTLGADIFHGDRSGRYGQFDQLDRAVLAVEAGL